ncbi:MAG: hypothetical protein GY755_08140, partial [Chloroflexi bacterium]|nr:hypothetical protein [Chloroflexota bacterium]
MTKNLIVNILAEDQEIVMYRKGLKRITGTVHSAILLSQMLYWHKKSNRKPFYKFRASCQHEKYREGDSWAEELGFSPSSFDNALRRIGTKITKGVSKTQAYEKQDATGIIVYWTDASRLTWYSVNEDLLGNLLSDNYLVNSEDTIT